jgi:hypothetical protein
MMKNDTSGLLFTQNKDGSVRLEVVDYGVSEFGGGDWESWYELDKVNADKLKAELAKTHNGSFEGMLVDEFTKEFDIPAFERFCREKGIIFSHATWRG